MRFARLTFSLEQTETACDIIASSGFADGSSPLGGGKYLLVEMLCNAVAVIVAHRDAVQVDSQKRLTQPFHAHKYLVVAGMVSCLV